VTVVMMVVLMAMVLHAKEEDGGFSVHVVFGDKHHSR